MPKILNDTTKNVYLANCLYDCIEDSNIRAIKKLLQENEANANIIIPDKGITPFHFAVGSGNENTAKEITKLFVVYGGDPNVRSVDKLTPVHIAAAWGRLNILKLLLEYGGDPNLTDDEGKTPLDYARTENCSLVIEYLQSYSQNTQITFDNLNDFNVTNKTTDKYLNISISSIDDNNSKEISLSDSTAQKSFSRLSGILTILESSNENILDKNMLENNQNNSTDYLTCESANTFEKNIANSMLTLDLSDEIINITSDKSIELLTKGSSNEDSVIGVEEEYKYTDNEEGIVLIEKRILLNPKNDDNNSETSKSSRITIDYDTDTLRHELTSMGEPPGPITMTTKCLYLRKLKKLQKNTLFTPVPATNENNRIYSVELEKTLRNPNWSNDLTSYRALESVVVNQFSKPEPSKRWREGLTKASFTYLLLDPRITLNLPLKSPDLPQEEIWKTFLSAIFYIGKGKRSRPYSHLYEAVNFWKNGQTELRDRKKISYILDIWKNNFGVVCLHIFQNVIPVEAYTREAAMINALKLQNLCNSKLGDFYGICATWPERKKRLLGVYLLYRAMLIFLNEGERQLMPHDIGK